MDSSPSTSDALKPSPMGQMPSDRIVENGNSSISVLRFLISNATAGSVIGKGGATICELQAQSGAKIQLSRNHEYFPGTTDRVVLLSGTMDQIMAAFKLILSKIHGEAEDLESKANQIKLVFPHVFCGAIIGKGGATIRTFMENSGAAIKLSSPEQAGPGFQDRIVSVAGGFDEQLHAVSLITNKISEDATYLQYASGSLHTGMAQQGMQQGMLQGPFTSAPALAPYSYGPIPYNDYHTKGVMGPYMVMHNAPFHMPLPLYPTNTPNTFIVIAVPDECIGAILGRGGKTILDIQQSSGVHIRISERGDFVPGTTHRKVTISGSPECIYAAQQIIMQKISQSPSLFA
ncbi:hypothetical protein GOP47_0020647 [Adiantum capillus-veneris]|uniref:K Homology domain-containing protein n=1 Tax=Adiantum capillus-veneris TaxID=13818 RepID=A0A9D4U9X4_ADICA|nr:hypothetical protein GOP47_0020647 [Adiantum capillus-veneris]